MAWNEHHQENSYFFITLYYRISHFTILVHAQRMHIFYWIVLFIYLWFQITTTNIFLVEIFKFQFVLGLRKFRLRNTRCWLTFKRCLHITMVLKKIVHSPIYIEGLSLECVFTLSVDFGTRAISTISKKIKRARWVRQWLLWLF